MAITLAEKSFLEQAKKTEQGTPITSKCDGDYGGGTSITSEDADDYGAEITETVFSQPLQEDDPHVLVLRGSFPLRPYPGSPSDERRDRRLPGWSWDL